MELKAFNISIQGASHIKINKECQDASKSFFENKKGIVVVCDGHGGEDYFRSSIGAEYASEIAEKYIKIFLENVSKEKFFTRPEEYLKKIEFRIVKAWNEKVEEHFKNNPFREEELKNISNVARKEYENGKIKGAYGTTLLVVAMTNEYWFGIHIGDGKCVVIQENGEFSEPIPWDNECFLNVTTSICDENALENFRDFYSENLPVAIFIGSDGIDDSFQNSEQLYNLYKIVLCSFEKKDLNFNQAVEELKSYLPKLSEKGSGDDVSISGIINFEKISLLKLSEYFDEKRKEKKLVRS